MNSIFFKGKGQFYPPKPPVTGHTGFEPFDSKKPFNVFYARYEDQGKYSVENTTNSKPEFTSDFNLETGSTRSASKLGKIVKSQLVEQPYVSGPIGLPSLETLESRSGANWKTAIGDLAEISESDFETETSSHTTSLLSRFMSILGQNHD